MRLHFSTSIFLFFDHSIRGCIVSFLFSFFFFSLGYSNPTTCDSVPVSTRVTWRYFSHFRSFVSSSALVDVVGIKGFQHYEFSRKERFFIATKGNIGHSARPLQFSPNFSTGFKLYDTEPHFGNSLCKETMRFYEPEHVFADLFYISGPKREQTFNVLYNQRLSEALVVGFNYRVLNSPGRYSRTAAANTNWYANFTYNHPRKRYGAIGGLVINRIKNQESGGLKDRLAFEANNWSDGGLLSNAELRDLGTTFFAHQFLKTGKKDLNLPEDSIGAKDGFGGRLFHDFSISRRSINFLDKSSPELSFFGLQPINNLETHDSTTILIAENSLGLIGRLQVGSRNSLKYKGYAKHRIARITQNVFDTIAGTPALPIRVYDFVRNSFLQVLVGGQVELKLPAASSFEAEGSFVALGRGIGDLSLESTFLYGLPGKSSEAKLSCGLMLQEAPFFLSSFLGNYVSWQNDFNKQRVVHAGLGFRDKLFSVDLKIFWLKDMVFVGPEAKPMQNHDDFGLVSLRGQLKKSFGPVNTLHDILIQYAGTSNFERFPLLTSYHTIFFELSLFKEAMFLNLGVDVFYNTPYKPMGFMPVVRQFFSQNSYQSGHVFSADIFGTFRVDRARFFLKAQNIASQIPAIPVMYQVPFYPLQDFAVKFGVSWLFFD